MKGGLADRLIGVEGLSGMTAIAWGIWLLNPAWHDFYPEHGAYHTMLTLAPGHLWGAWLLTLGLATQIMLIWPRQRLLPAPVTLLSASWAFIAFSFARHAIPATALPVYTTLMTYTAYSFNRLLAGSDGQLTHGST